MYVVDEDRPVFREIETGLTNEDNVEVLANFGARCDHCRRGAAMLEDGDRIRVAGAGAPGRSKEAKSPGTGAATKSGNGPGTAARNSGT